MQYIFTPTNATCPVCSCTKATLLYQITSQQAAQWFFLREREAERNKHIQDAIENVWQGTEARFLQCTHCAFCFADPYVAGDSIFYSRLYESPNYPSWKWEFDMTLKALRQNIGKTTPDDVRLLEIGAGDGAFVRRLVGEKVVDSSNILTLEYSVYGKSRIEEEGITCLPVDVRMLDREHYRGHFTTVCMFQVLEHLDNLEELFLCLNDITAPSAAIYIAVPNDKRVTFNEQHDALGDMMPCHVGRWNKHSFEAVADKFGWEVKGHAYEPESVFWRFLEFSLYRYVERTKVSGSLFNTAEAIQNRFLRYSAQIPLISAMALYSLPLLPSLFRKDLGKSQWVELRKV